MKHKKLRRVFIFIFTIVIIVWLTSIVFDRLTKVHLVSEVQSKLSDWISALVSTLAFVSGTVAVFLAYRSLRLTQKAEEGNLYITMMEKYSSMEMVKALQTLGQFYRESKGNFEHHIKEWNQKKIAGDESAKTIENARHLVKYFYRDLMQLVQAGYFSEKLAKRICNTGGRFIFHDVVLPMDALMNPFLFKGEYDPFPKIFNQLNSEQNSNRKRRSVCLIPARYDASRFDGKLLKILVDKKNGKEKTVIRETYERMVSYKLFDDVMVVTNSPEIKMEIEQHGGKVIFSDRKHNSGTDRIAEAAESVEADLIFNVQGDEPFIAKRPLEDLLELMVNQPGELVVASLMKEMKEPEHINSSDYVKVTQSKSGKAINFTRSLMPYPKKNLEHAKYFEHVGVYVFTRKALLSFAKMEPTPLEIVESIECLRFTENDIPVLMIETDTFLIEIDTEEDHIRVNELLESGQISLV